MAIFYEIKCQTTEQKVRGKVGRKLIGLGFSSDTAVWVINNLKEKYF